MTRFERYDIRFNGSPTDRLDPKQLNVLGRKSALKALMRFMEPMPEIRARLSQYAADTEDVQENLCLGDIQGAVQRFLNNEITGADLIEWANIIDGEDDILIPDDATQAVLHRISNVDPADFQKADRQVQKACLQAIFQDTQAPLGIKEGFVVLCN